MDNIDLLIIKYISKNISSAEKALLLQWLEKDKKNQIYFRSLKDIYDLGKFESDVRDSMVMSQWTKFTNKLSTGKSRNRILIFTFMRYAALFVIGALLSYFIYSYQGNTEEEFAVTVTKIETGIGERSKVTLPDGSTIWINACSSITFDNTFGREQRAVNLNGEAYFDVKTDTIKPFLVHTDLMKYRVTGTSFNVYSFSDEAETSIALLEGGISVEYDSLVEKLLPGEQLIHNRETGENIREKVNVSHISSWRYGDFTFDDLTFEELSKRLERMFNVKFMFENNQVSNIRFGGTLPNNYSLEQIMKVINTSIPLNYKMNKNTIYIY